MQLIAICMQEADGFLERTPASEHGADYSWQSVFVAACGLMWEETGEAKYAPPPPPPLKR